MLSSTWEPKIKTRSSNLIVNIASNKEGRVPDGGIRYRYNVSYSISRTSRNKLDSLVVVACTAMNGAQKGKMQIGNGELEMKARRVTAECCHSCSLLPGS